MVSTRLASCLLVLTLLLAAASVARPQYPVSAPSVMARIQLGQCDKQVVYNLPAQRFDVTARAIAHATGCFIRYTDKSLINVPVQPVRSRLTWRQATGSFARHLPAHRARNA